MKAKTNLLFLLFLLTATAAWAQSPKYEVRAAWLATIGGIDWPRSSDPVRQQRELCDMLDQLQLAHVNTVLFQTRVRASTVYPSEMEPFDVCLTGTHGRSPGYDPLQFAIDECHKRGMECHAWMVTLPIGKVSEPRCKEFMKRHPRMAVRVGQEAYMNPERPETGDYLARICHEVVSRYDVDGVHLDYIRYPETWKLKIPRQQARDNITAIVRKIHHAVKQEKPWVKLSCSPIGKYDDLSRYKSGGWNANTRVYQDAQSWMRDGLMDELFPMMYFQGNQFFPFAIDWQEQAYGRIVVPGLSIYMLDPREGRWTLDVVEREMYFLRQLGLGHCFFRAKFLTGNPKGILDFVSDFDRTPALIPPMDWTPTAPPSAPQKLDVARGATLDLLSWSKAADHSGAPYLLYNIYASTAYPVDTSDPRNLVATRLTGRQLAIPHRGAALNYAVTAQDRYGKESPATDSQPRPQRTAPAKPLMSPRDTGIPPFYYQQSGRGKKQKSREGRSNKPGKKKQ